MKTYHRDDLKADILRAGLALLAEQGHDKLSVRALAQAVGVSAAAPYHHFADRRALLLALAVDGFERLWERGRDSQTAAVSPAAALIGLGTAFLGFQADHPRLLELMYESELTRPRIDPRIVQEQLRGFDLLRGAIRDAVPGVAEAETRARAIAFWSAIYGHASLAGKGLLQPFASSDGDEAAAWRDAVVRHAVLAAMAPSAAAHGL